DMDARLRPANKLGSVSQGSHFQGENLGYVLGVIMLASVERAYQFDSLHASERKPRKNGDRIAKVF
ncbi:MAG: hypothetical protein ACU83P_05145, partial [Gammaproteobacteria bacterium]